MKKKNAEIQAGGDDNRRKFVGCPVSILLMQTWSNEWPLILYDARQNCGAGTIRLRATKTVASQKKKQRTRINIGVALPKWMSVMVASGFQSNTEVAFIVGSVRESVFSRFANEYFK